MPVVVNVSDVTKRLPPVSIWTDPDTAKVFATVTTAPLITGRLGMADGRNAWCRFAPVSVAPVRVRLAPGPIRYPCISCQLVGKSPGLPVIPPEVTPARYVSIRFAHLRSAWYRSAQVRFAEDRFAQGSLAPSRSA